MPDQQRRRRGLPAHEGEQPQQQPARRRGLPQTEETPEADAAAETQAPGGAETPSPQGSTAGRQETPRRRTGLPSNADPAPASEPAGASTAASSTTTPSAKDPAPAQAGPQGPSEPSGAPVRAAAEPAQGTKTRTAGAAGRSMPRWAVWSAAGAAGAVVLAALLVLGSRWFLGTETGANFLSIYPGEYEQPGAPSDYPWWLNWAHFFNAFLMVLIIKTGIQVRTETRPEAHWSPRWNRKRRISLTIWLHQVLDLLWVVNGAAFVVLLFATGYWTRVVPTSWEIFPNAVSAALQYMSLDWPTHQGWAHYNSLQELTYFTTIFIAAPLAILTGLRLSGVWPQDKKLLNRLVPIELARALHFPVMIYFAVFILTHVLLVLATDALVNLNQIYTGQAAANWTGFWLFVLSLLVIGAGLVLARAVFVAPLASLFGRVGR